MYFAEIKEGIFLTSVKCNERLHIGKKSNVCEQLYMPKCYFLKFLKSDEFPTENFLINHSQAYILFFFISKREQTMTRRVQMVRLFYLSIDEENQSSLQVQVNVQ